jgi:nitroreductase
VDIETLREFASRQRAIRRFDTSRDVDDALVEQALTVGTHAPSGGNRQQYRFVVVKDPQVKKQLSDVYDTLATARYGDGGRTRWADVPVLVAVCSEGAGPASAGSEGLRAATAASVLPAVQNILLAVTALGLGSVLTTLWKDEEARVRDVLGLPDGVEVHAILPIGWPDRKYGRNHRLPVAEVTHRDRYGNGW